jgi:hypothetical protein
MVGNLEVAAPDEAMKCYFSRVEWFILYDVGNLKRVRLIFQ